MTVPTVLLYEALPHPVAREPDHARDELDCCTQDTIPAGANGHVNICFVPTVVVASFLEQCSMQMQDVVASGTFQKSSTFWVACRHEAFAKAR